jgi:spore germination cell wall hydrolase CwlJ-like protein
MGTPAKPRALTAPLLTAAGLGIALTGVHLGARWAESDPHLGPDPKFAQVALKGYDRGEKAWSQTRRQADGSARRPATIVHLEPARTATPPVRSRDLDCLTQAVYYEARGEPLAGQAAVAQVVLNRARHPAFPKTVCEVVYQGVHGPVCQFSFLCDGSMRRPKEPLAWDTAREVARRALGGYVMKTVARATAYHAVWLESASHPSPGAVRVGGHVFYAMGGGFNPPGVGPQT